jgi:hypothetical protein
LEAGLGLVEGGREVGRADSTVVPLAGSVLGAALPKAAENQLVEFFIAHSDRNCSRRIGVDPADIGQYGQPAASSPGDESLACTRP